jgi:hypothetical protein
MATTATEAKFLVLDPGVQYLMETETSSIISGEESNYSSVSTRLKMPTAKSSL